MMRDAKICEIGEGTSEVQRIVISRAELAQARAGSTTTSDEASAAPGTRAGD
jgi:hypothetical protein